MRIDPGATPEIEAAFAAAQARTRASLCCVVAESSADYALAPMLGLAALALATPWPLLIFTALSPSRIFSIQLAVFALGLGLLSLASVRAALAAHAHRRSACYRAAIVQFAQRGLGHAEDRSGVLLYISLTERYARVVADAGLDAHIPHAVWRGLIAELGAGLRAGDANSALQTAAARMGELLAPVFPAKAGAEAPHSKRFHLM